MICSYTDGLFRTVVEGKIEDYGVFVCELPDDKTGMGITAAESAREGADVQHSCVTTDQLLGLKPVRSTTKKPQGTRLWRKFKQVEKLSAKERRLIDTFLEREKLRGKEGG